MASQVYPCNLHFHCQQFGFIHVGDGFVLLKLLCHHLWTSNEEDERQLMLTGIWLCRFLLAAWVRVVPKQPKNRLIRGSRMGACHSNPKSWIVSHPFSLSFVLYTINYLRLSWYRYNNSWRWTTLSHVIWVICTLESRSRSRSKLCNMCSVHYLWSIL